MTAESKPNLILILSDDHRYDFMGFHPESPDFLETPNLDRLAAQGAFFENAFVTTSLCSPSRASILTGQYMHHHRVIDNQRPVPEGTTFFAEHLQKEGYETAFVGKWHMGHDDDSPRKGFDHWVSFVGQGVYFDPILNVNGKRVQEKGYMADILASYALDWLKERKSDKPFLLYLSFKSVHYPFQPAPRHHGRYQDKPIPYPETMALTEENYLTQPKWVKERRYGIHGIDHMVTGAFDQDPVPSFDDLYWRFCETVHGLDENIGRVIRFLDDRGLSDESFGVYLGDNGFALGEHGFYDKRDAFEESIRIPMIAWSPRHIKAGTKIENMVLNIDIAPSLLDVASGGELVDPGMDGRSFVPLLKGNRDGWRDHMIYEYYWEWNFPATPTTFAIRTDTDKYIYYHGVWDRNGYYQLDSDSHERHNLIDLPQFQSRIESLRTQLFDELESSGALTMPIRRPKGVQFYDRKLP